MSEPQHHRIWPIRIFQILVIMFCVSAMADEPSAQPNRIFEQTGQILDPGLNEISGMAASGYADNLFWVLNDSGNPPELYLIDNTGQVIGTIRIENASNVDWEDIGSFTINDRHYLIIADTGDNMAARSQSRLIVIPEPVRPLPEAVTPSAVLTFQYEDGPRDCESVAVDPSAGKIFLLSKRDHPPQLYELPLHLTGSTWVETARRAGSILSIPIQQSYYPYGASGGYNTAMDFSPSGRQAVVLTYRNIHLFSRQMNESWLSAMNRPFLTIPLPELNQPEGICFSVNGTAIYLTSEKIPAPILKIDLNDFRLSQQQKTEKDQNDKIQTTRQ
jgi:hypothetical protein